MRISKKEALNWFSYFASVDAENFDEIISKYYDIIESTFFQLERTIDSRNSQLISQIPNIQRLQNRTYFVGKEEQFPKGCKSCLCGTGLSTVRKTNKCNLECDFCYYYGSLDSQREIPEDIWEIGGTKFYERDIDILLSTSSKPTGIAYAYLEPFMEIDKYYKVIEKFSESGIHQHLYTNGLLASEESLRKLGESGLDEIRFNLGASDCSDEVINYIAMAKKYIKRVGIETPMTPTFYTTFIDKKDQILDTKLDFINCAELHLNPNNIGNYTGENMYMCRNGYISPIWSRELTLKLMKMADDEHWNVLVHDCSNHTKFARELNFSNQLNLWFGASNYSNEFEQIPFKYFLPILEDEQFMFIDEEELPQDKMFEFTQKTAV